MFFPGMMLKNATAQNRAEMGRQSVSLEWVIQFVAKQGLFLLKAKKGEKILKARYLHSKFYIPVFNSLLRWSHKQLLLSSTLQWQSNNYP